jgi:hypothetical protein
MGVFKTRRIRHCCCTVAATVFLFSPALVRAQAVVDPASIEFTPSEVNDQVMANGQPYVSSYSLELYYLGASQPFRVVSLGKPAPDPDGKIRTNFLSRLLPPPDSGLTYVTRVVANGSGGVGHSDDSDDFALSGACHVALSSTSQAFSGSGGPGDLTVDTASWCPWTATSSAAWVLVIGGDGTDAAPITYSVAENLTGAARTASIVVNDQTLSISQSAGSPASCGFALSTSTASFTSLLGAGTVDVMSTSNTCTWTAASNVSWLTVTSGSSGTGAGTVGYAVAANTSTTSRTGTLTIGGMTFSVTQSAPAATTCSYTVTLSPASFGPAGGSGTATVAAAAGCSWTMTSSASWLTVPAATASGKGAGTAKFTVGSNNSSTSRSGALSVGAKNSTVNQSGTGTQCSPSISSSTLAFAATGGVTTVSVTAPAGCTWTWSSSASWITLSSPTKTGSSVVTVSVARNSVATMRTASLTIAGISLKVTQAPAGAACIYTMSAIPSKVSATSSKINVTITTLIGCNWSVSSSAAWIVPSPKTGTESGMTVLNIAANTSGATRNASVSIPGWTAYITQAAN